MTPLQTAPDTALLVIDVQASFPARPYWKEDECASFLAAQNRLIAGFVARQCPIVRIFHVEETGAFALDSGLVKPLDGLADFSPAHTVYKHAHSALAGTTLESWLIRRGIRQLVVSGIRTEQCCETTTRQGSDLGFTMLFVTEATLTFPMINAAGKTFSASSIRERTELVLADRFARIVSVEQALDTLHRG
jgi:nicotinamidase-related amidase